jgi:hypothetical protein
MDGRYGAVRGIDDEDGQTVGRLYGDQVTRPVPDQRIAIPQKARTAGGIHHPVGMDLVKRRELAAALDIG